MQRARNVKGGATARQVATGKGAPSCTVVSETELQRYQDIVDNAATKAVEAEKARRDQIRLTSEARVAHWPNTIEAQRLRKEQLRQERLDREEERRLLIDEEERVLREHQKAQAVERANVLLYEENDKIKSFTSKLFLATVLEEREKQLAIKEERRRLEKELELEACVTEQETLRRAEEKEKKKIHDSQQRTCALKSAQLQQLEDLRQQKIKERDENRAEGARIRHLAEQAAEEERLAEAHRKEQQKFRGAELEKTNDEMLHAKKEQKQKEKAEDERIASFAQLKEQQMTERKTRADQKFVAKLRARQQLIDLQSKQLEELRATVEERELKAMRDFDRERRERERIENEKRERRQREIESYRAAELETKKQKKSQEAAEFLRMKDIWKERADTLIDEELLERRQQRAQAERLQHFHLLQAQEKRQQALKEKRTDIEEGLQLQNALKEEQDMYNTYVNSVMCEYVSKGRGGDLVRLAASRSKVKSA